MVKNDGETDLYAVLAVPRDASEEDIKRAYRLLAQTYHPDKHSEKEMQEIASLNFNRVKRAYDVLSDPDQRNIYDVYGLEGLEAGMELGEALKTPEEIRRALEQAELLKAKQKAADAVNHHGSYVFGLSMAHMLHSRNQHPASNASDREKWEYQYREALAKVPWGPLMTRLSMTSIMQTPLSQKDVAVIGGSISSERGKGGGSLQLGLKRQCSAVSTLEFNASAGHNSYVNVEATRQLSAHSQGAVEWTLTGEGAVLGVRISRQLYSGSTGYVLWNIGTEGMVSGVTVGTQFAGNKWNYKWNMFANSNGLGVGGTAVRKLGPKSHLVAASSLKLMDLEVEAGGGRMVSNHSRVTLTLALSLKGLVLKFKFKRGSQKFDFPITLTNMFPPPLTIFAGAILLPPATLLVLHQAVVKPLQERRRQRKLIQAQKENEEAVAAGRKAAEEAVKLMHSTLVRKRPLEEDSGGLVVICARYGSEVHTLLAPDTPEEAPAPGPSSEEPGTTGAGLAGADSSTDAGGIDKALSTPPWIDVTDAVQFQVSASEVRIPGTTSKKDLLGFCDPCPGIPKQLYVRYLSKFAVHEVTLEDNDAVQLPDSNHRLPEIYFTTT